MRKKPFKISDYQQVTSIKGDMCLRRRSDGVVFYALTRNGDNGDVEAVGPICRIPIMGKNAGGKPK